ncbi:uncharacterized protein LOC144449676 [Glandiceps talaboti]
MNITNYPPIMNPNKYKTVVENDLLRKWSTLKSSVDLLRKGLLQLERNMSRWRNDEGISATMMKRALKHVESTIDFQRVILHAIQTKRALHIGVAGGSISATRYCYANILVEAMQATLGIPVILHNAAIGATDSRYFAYCFGYHLNIHELDIVLWEFAANDFIKKIGPWAQEEFTRMVLELPNRPQLIFVNFLHGAQMESKSPCLNNEKIASEPLSEYYNVCSISMPDGVCPAVKEGKYADLIAGHGDNHPSMKSHRMVGTFLTELFKEVLYNLTNSKTSVHSLETLAMKLSPRNGIQKPLFKDAILNSPNCWSFMGTKENTSVQLSPIKVDGWQLLTPKKQADPTRTDIKRFWQSDKPQGIIIFTFDIPPYKDLNCTVSISTSGCPQCGKAKVYIDEDEEGATIVNGKWGYAVTLTQRICFNLCPGTHNLTLVSQDRNPFRLAAIMTSYRL